MVSRKDLEIWVRRSSRWSALSRAGKSPLVKSFSVVPALSGLLTLLLSTQVITVNDISWKVICWFFGANLIGIFVILFRARCPEIILYFENMWEYGKLHTMILRERYNKLLGMLQKENRDPNSLMKFDEWFQDDGFRPLVGSSNWTDENPATDESKCRLLFYNHIFHNCNQPKIRALLLFFYYTGIILISTPTIYNIGSIAFEAAGYKVLPRDPALREIVGCVETSSNGVSLSDANATLRMLENCFGPTAYELFSNEREIAVRVIEDCLVDVEAPYDARSVLRLFGACVASTSTTE